MSKKRRFLDESDEEDPTSGIINLTDCMLVLAVGFLVFAIMAMQSNPALLSESSGAVQNTVSVNGQSQSLNNSPNNGSSTGNGYEQVGTVYKDPETGKLIMVN
ncbi:MAG: DUF2149 domain-containing protein [Methanobacterium sp. ERen5]|nr:MAG: DUF2149 domain-containing protein [Methanobacterium sp. ERen5]